MHYLRPPSGQVAHTRLVEVREAVAGEHSLRDHAAEGQHSEAAVLHLVQLKLLGRGRVLAEVKRVCARCG